MQRLPMLYGCRLYHGDRWTKDYIRPYYVPNYDMYMIFSREEGDLECFGDRELSYPFERSCTQDAVKGSFKGEVAIPNTYAENCPELISGLLANVTEEKGTISKNVKVGNDQAIRVCYDIGKVVMNIEVECPKEFENYRIEPRNFFFQRISTGPIKNKAFFRSPNISQYEYLKSQGHPAVDIDNNYDYDSHENDYE